ncbi:glycoside hydrolase family 1 protein [Lactobacillus helveticus]|jgi:6-phospho-beta-glucosidase|nr:glycoside hydrolase family 1 protein [Lactobacillus helveticus]ADX70425.1 Glycosyl hydrolase family 1 [Lactobacillus helveticus H10]ALI52763.1 6-phospho-beta-glucosidase [Lactobacillus helveticus]NRN72070.1 Aryl-phospho-beta-D-glucosidase BglH [Lactobacillus helveticus]NRN74040.1 Aryl-phospho-beta-D-glucosidase BglH [Lactobacillus helveticus]NRN83901.1 Aryl-phospho-beta-D-glucosidase BglH [Lactobacillus helveticus]
MTEKRKLPSTFLWGNSVSSMQTEGAWNEDGKGLSVYDVRPATDNTSDWHVAIDEYHRYDEDLDLLKNMNMNMYRIQISWSRVCPDGDGDFNQKGIDFYDRLVNAMLKRGIQPMICLYHFDMPLNLAQKYNGFMSQHVVDAFVRFGKKMIDHFSDRVKYWIVFNEHNLYFQDEVFNISGYESGDKSLDDMYTIFHHTMMCHIRLANYIHENYSDVKIGGMLAYQQIYPATSKPEDVWAAKQVQEFLNFNIYDADTGRGYSLEVMQYAKNHGIEMDITDEDKEIMKKAKADFLAFSYYSSWVLSSNKIPEGEAPNRYLNKGGVESKYVKTNDWGWAIDPLGFRNAITTMYNYYRIPIFPIENGIGLKETWDGEHMIEDDERIAYHRDHIKAMKDAIFDDGAEVLGYLGWGLIDIPSSHADMEKRYGAVYVNRSNHDLKDLKRVPKKSFYWFQKVLKDNGDEL